MIDYYDEHSESYFNETKAIDSSRFLADFRKYLAHGATVLDVGCGSGRDLLWLKNKGFKPTGFERSSNLAALARKISGCCVVEGDFTSYDFSRHRFDAMILVAALVHVDRSEFKDVLGRILEALNCQGHLFLSLKQGDGELRFEDDRVFVLWSDDALKKIFSNLKLNLLEHNQQVSELRQQDIWLSYILQKG